MQTSASSLVYKNETIDFLTWCEEALGIETLLEIRHFDYPNVLDEHQQQRDSVDGWDGDDEFAMEITNTTMMSVRGLAASRDIWTGERIIRIPLHSLWSVSTLIDNDPFLVDHMGEAARQVHGWDCDDDEMGILFELGLLSVALLHHANLRDESPWAPYSGILGNTSMEAFPFLWSKKEFRESPLGHSNGIRKVAVEIRRDIRDMYTSIVQELIREHPDVYGRREGEEWGFSFAKFERAFGLVNSRHWNLPIVDLDSSKHEAEEHHTWTSEDGVLPPADTPTDEWVEENHDLDDDIPYDDDDSPTAVSYNKPTVDQWARDEKERQMRQQKNEYHPQHSFLAPVADLLNYGPPCARGSYNAETQTFDIHALCDFKKGQEVTFMYNADACSDVMMGMYGFVHPMIPPCLAAEEWKDQAEQTKQRLNEALDEVEILREDLHYAEDALAGCNCEGKRNHHNMRGGRVRRSQHSHPHSHPEFDSL